MQIGWVNALCDKVFSMAVVNKILLNNMLESEWWHCRQQFMRKKKGNKYVGGDVISMTGAD